VLDAPDAARITKATPGRAYVRLGHASLVPFQTGRVSGPYTAGMPSRDATARTATAIWLAPLSWADLGRQEPAPPPFTRPADEEITDLKVLRRAGTTGRLRAGRPRPAESLAAPPPDRSATQRPMAGWYPAWSHSDGRLPRPASTRTCRAEPHRLHAPHGGRRAAQRTVPAAAPIAGALALAHSCGMCTCTGSTAGTVHCYRSPAAALRRGGKPDRSERARGCCDA